MFWTIFFFMLAVRIYLKAYYYHQRNIGLRVVTPGYWRRKLAWMRQQVVEKREKEAEFVRLQQIIAEREQWIVARRLEQRKNLNILGMSEFPESYEELKKARKQAIFNTHPDRGGTGLDIVQIDEACQKLISYLGLKKAV
jgi:hypothetical protein